MRGFILIVALALAGCQKPQPQAAAKAARPDATQTPAYIEALKQLRSWNEKAEEALQAGKIKAAGDAVNSGLPLGAKLLKVDKPTLVAAEVVSDLDDLYGRILLARRQYGYARMQFQKNAARWKSWLPQTEETTRRLKLAQSRIAECDRKMGL